MTHITHRQTAAESDGDLATLSSFRREEEETVSSTRSMQTRVRSSFLDLFHCSLRRRHWYDTKQDCCSAIWSTDRKLEQLFNVVRQSKRKPSEHSLSAHE